ncbi:helix-turn-helix domain-containing protein, partial [Mediterraneibacter faecis]
RTIQAQTVCRARILLLRADGVSIDDIADKVGINRCSVMLCLNKFKEGGVENALFDAPGRGRNAEITDDEKAWIINIACQKPVDLGYSAEVWTRALLTKHINKFAEEEGHTRLSTISQSKVRTILKEADIKPNKITYYCENRDPDFDEKM